MSKNINPEFLERVYNCKEYLLACGIQFSASVSTRDAVDTILVSPSSLVCIKTAAMAFSLASYVLYMAGHHRDGSDGC